MFKFVIVALALVASASASLRLQVAGAGPYEAPPCSSGEQAVQISGVSGDYCAPKCSGTTCPAAPTGDAKAECVVEEQGSSKPTLCALICEPGTTTCPTGATCQAIQGVGICTYSS